MVRDLDFRKELTMYERVEDELDFCDDFSPIEEREPPSDRTPNGKRIEPGGETFGGTAAQRAKAEKAGGLQAVS